MNRRTKYRVFLLLWIVLFFLLGSGVWNFQAGELALIIYLVVSVLAYVACAFARRCGSCGMPLLLRPVKALGIEFYLWSIIPPGKCRHCGEPDR